MSKVSLLKCEEYNYDLVLEKVKETFNNLGGIEKFIKPNQKVLLKPNLIARKAPHTMTTTHPLFIKAVASLISQQGAEIVIADSPGGLYKDNIMDRFYSSCGLKDIAKEIKNVNLNYDMGYKNISFEGSFGKRNFDIINPVFDADIIINLAKLKTHVMANYTGAVKNVFGVIPGLTKAEYHFKCPEKEDFFSLIVDLCCYVKPTLSLIDGIYMMEGDGPSNGNPKKSGVIIGSESPFMADLLASELIGFKIEEVYTVNIGNKLGFNPKSASEIEIIGDNYNDLIINDVKKPNVQSHLFDSFLPKPVKKLVENMLTPYPKIIESRCIGCNNCVEICPPKVMKLSDRKKAYLSDKKECIKCYCCHELCPKDAINLKKLPKFLR